MLHRHQTGVHLASPVVVVLLFVRETGRTLRQRFCEHLRSTKKNLPGFPVAEHFSANSHCLCDAQVCGIMLCAGNKHRKRQEMRLIFQTRYQ